MYTGDGGSSDDGEGGLVKREGGEGEGDGDGDGSDEGECCSLTNKIAHMSNNTTPLMTLQDYTCLSPLT